MDESQPPVPAPEPIANGDLRAASARAASMKATLAPRREAKERAILAAIAALETEGQPFSQRQAEEAAWGKATGYIAKNAVALAAFRAAIARINALPTPTPHSPLPTPPQTPDSYQQRLEEDNARLQAEIEALRAQLEQTPKHSATPDLVLLQALKDEDRKLRLDAANLLDRITEMEQTRQQLLSNADVVQRLIEQRESAIEREETAVVAVAATNGHKQLAEVAR